MLKEKRRRASQLWGVVLGEKIPRTSSGVGLHNADEGDSSQRGEKKRNEVTKAELGPTGELHALLRRELREETVVFPILAVLQEGQRDV